jgi:predicted helicase
LLQLGLIEPKDLARKYAHELHANEILLLAYYIAAVNIETTYQDLRGELGDPGDYEPFPGLILTDTFQSWEEGDTLDTTVFVQNNERLERLKALDIQVIVGNPPYSSGQDSANDDNQNTSYPTLDASIRQAYSSERGRGGNNSLYDSYIRAIRWASLRLDRQGVIAFVTNGGWLDSNVGAQMRESLAADFSAIHIYNLRGNGRVGGEAGRAEGRPVFEFAGWGPGGMEKKSSKGGSRATIAVTLLVRDPKHQGPAVIRYSQVADGLSAGEKLRELVQAVSITQTDHSRGLTPDAHGDWLTHRRRDFAEFIPLGAKHGEDSEGLTLFDLYGRGLETGRDMWVYQSSPHKLAEQVGLTIEAFNSQVAGFSAMVERLARRPKDLVNDFIDKDPTRISWTLSLKNRLASGRRLNRSPDAIRGAVYRPFFRQHVYFDRGLNHISGQTPRFFPSVRHQNLGVYQVGLGSAVPFSVLMVGMIPDLHVTGAGSGGQFFARWRYEKVEAEDGMFSLDTAYVEDAEVIDGYRRIDNITDHALTTFRAAYGDRITKDDIFFYVYGLLHSPDYRETYAADLKKMLPRVPLVTDPWPYIEAGQRLSELHLGYETVQPYPLAGLDDPAPTGDAAYDHFRVEKMTFGRRRSSWPIARRSSTTRGSRSAASPRMHTATNSEAGRRSSGSSTATGSRSTVDPRAQGSSTTPTTGPVRSATRATSSTCSPASSRSASRR